LNAGLRLRSSYQPVPAVEGEPIARRHPMEDCR
jgi:hypothetical protein